MTLQQYERLENIVKSLLNKNSVVYSNHSKTADTISNGICSLTMNSIDKSFIFTYGRNRIIINLLDNSIKNLVLINDILVSDIITESNIMNNVYLKQMFSNIDKVLDLYKEFVKINEENNNVSISNLLIETINGYSTEDLALKNHTHEIDIH